MVMLGEDCKGEEIEAPHKESIAGALVLLVAARLLRPIEVIALFASICLSFTPALALKPMRSYPALPSDYGIVYEELTLTTRDSLHIKAWFFPVQDTAGIANDIVGRLIPVPPELKRAARAYTPSRSRPAPAVVICNGDAGNMTYLIFYAYHFFTRGFNVLTFDWRGFGESDEWPMEQDLLSCTEFLTDYDAALDAAKIRNEVDPKRIGVLGFSTGAYLSFAETAKRGDIAAFVGRALLTSFEDVLPLIRAKDPARNWRAPADYPGDLLPANAAARVSAAVFLIVGEKDDRTPPWMSRKIFEILAGPKDLWIVPGAGHGGSEAPEMTNYPEFFTRAAAFFDRHLKERK